ncbi:MAG: ectoine/hydroxyectoine ABC transporter permease subunit EhuC [Anaerolineales bacterium]
MPPPFDIIAWLLPGALVTIKVTLSAAALALVVAILMGIARSSKNRIIKALSGFYVELFRGTSALVQLFWIFFVLPLPPFEIFLTPFQAGVIALGLNLGAYGAEVVRGAIGAVPKDQIEAGVALNFTPMQRMRRIILPQAMVRILPPFGNLLVELLKATALVSLITLSDLTFEGLKLQQTVGRTTEIFTILLFAYFVIAYPLSRGVHWLENRREWR